MKKKKKIPHSIEERGIRDVRILFGRNGQRLFYLFEVNVFGSRLTTVGGIVCASSVV